MWCGEALFVVLGLFEFLGGEIRFVRRGEGQRTRMRVMDKYYILSLQTTSVGDVGKISVTNINRKSESLRKLRRGSWWAPHPVVFFKKLWIGRVCKSNRTVPQPGLGGIHVCGFWTEIL